MDTICAIYILSNKNDTVLYTGVTSDLADRLYAHKNKVRPLSFAARYNLYKLVYFEQIDSISDAILREKQIKAGSRKRKVELIESNNPTWDDLTPSITGCDAE